MSSRRPSGTALAPRRAERAATVARVLVRVRLFAALRERAGAERLELELPEGACVADALAAVEGLAAGLPLVLAVNRRYAHPEQLLRPGDELAVVPPVSGGSARVHAAVVDHPLSLDALVARVQDTRAGAVVTFSGVTRDVAFLDYEGYAEMAVAELAGIVERAVAAHGLCAAAAEHRTGRVATSEASILVAASAPHRPAAFAGAREIIDRVKERVPIWKREEGTWKHEHLPPVGEAGSRPARSPT